LTIKNKFSKNKKENIKIKQKETKGGEKTMITILLTAKETAKLLNIKPVTVYAWTRQGILKGVVLKQGKRRTLRWRLEDIKEFLNSREKIGLTAT
jgi:excisionase family DNA binding protein